MTEQTTLLTGHQKSALKKGLRQLGLEGCKRSLHACVNKPEEIITCGQVYLGESKY